ncbi:phosphofructokinase [Microbacterium sp. dk485]|uniref:1-phosphofructokinase family hexose kinase n=1 Tax=Microbacterium sp. dk485 TaxID=2560021 RepID=UPI0010746CEC|nr:PfkB family carbohydrate kinase [Microbacterium sp. dk485]TFV81016.1 phosphofructokinase [Microbacterium sp. dk485]
MSDVTIFAPSPLLTVTVEQVEGSDEIHIHAGGQGVWQARMLRSLGIDVTVCCALTGEIGSVLRDRIAHEGVTVSAVERAGRGAAYVHDRRGGEREEIAEQEGDPLNRHDLDELYSLTLRDGLEAGLVVLSGPAGEGTLPADLYRRLASDLRQAGARVVVDLAGERLAAALEGGVDVLKVSHEEVIDDGLAEDASVERLLPAMHELRSRGAGAVIVTRASDPLLFLDDDGALQVASPDVVAADSRGAGDSLTAGVVAGLARGEGLRDALTLGAAAGALNATHHGLGTGEGGAIERLREAVTVGEIPRGAPSDTPTAGRVSPDGLAALAEPPTDTDEKDPA